MWWTVAAASELSYVALRQRCDSLAPQPERVMIEGWRTEMSALVPVPPEAVTSPYASGSGVGVLSGEMRTACTVLASSSVLSATGLMSAKRVGTGGAESVAGRAGAAVGAGAVVCAGVAVVSSAGVLSAAGWAAESSARVAATSSSAGASAASGASASEVSARSMPLRATCTVVVSTPRYTGSVPPVPVVLSPLPSTASASNHGPHEPSGFWARTLASAWG